jgi:hypothetical protein
METVKKKKDAGFIRGVVTFTSFLIKGERAKEIDNFLRTAQNIEPSLYESLVQELHSLCESREIARENLVVATGRALVSRMLVGDTTYSGAINYGALGTSSTAASSGQTQLIAEVKRKLFARRTRSSHQATFDFYYSKNDTDGTYEEFGTFVDGTDTANSGQMFNRVLTGGWTKTDQEALTVSITFSVNES